MNKNAFGKTIYVKRCQLFIKTASLILLFLLINIFFVDAAVHFSHEIIPIQNAYSVSMNNSIKKRAKSITSLAYQQKNILIKGRILDEKGDAIIGANVIEKKRTTNGASTDINGNFTISVPADAVLIITYIGYIQQEITVNGRKELRIILVEDAQTIDEVVVTGYQRLDRKLFTGAADVVKADDAKIDGISDVSRMLQGKSAGVQITNVSGTFGASPKIRVRGASSIYGNQKPLWVVDGVVLEDVVELSADDLSSGNAETLISSAVAGLNADDIASFQILKDASATALYGARAMNGVVVITTKSGRSGATRINYTGELTAKLRPTYSRYNIMNSVDQMSVYKEMFDKGWLNYAQVSRYSSGGEFLTRIIHEEHFPFSLPLFSSVG